MKAYKNEDKILVVLDLDETLLFATKNPLNYQEDFKVFDYLVYKRPHLEAFLEEIHKHFLIAIWSSASDEYVNEVVNNSISPEINLEFVWGRSKCTYKSNLNYEVDSATHYHYIKRLQKLKKKGYKIEKILIVDDTPHKSQENYGNAIYPKEFLGDQNDKELCFLQPYLISLKDVQNVRCIEKREWRTNFINNNLF